MYNQGQQPYQYQSPQNQQYQQQQNPSGPGGGTTGAIRQNQTKRTPTGIANPPQAPYIQTFPAATTSPNIYIPPQQNVTAAATATTNPPHYNQQQSQSYQHMPPNQYLNQSGDATTTANRVPQYQQNQFIPNNKGVDQYISEFQSSTTGQIGMQLGTQALSNAKQHISSNVGRYIDILQWRYYFNVSNSYVLNKLQLLVFPFLHKGWDRIAGHTDDTGQVVAFAPPRSDLNAPDLYIPVMSFITYVIITGIVSGLDNTVSAVGKGFSPDVLGLTASTAFFLTLFDVCFVKTGNYFLNVTADSPILELFAYSGYKFIPISIVLLIKHFAGSLPKIIAFSYLFFAYGFFTLRSLRGLVNPEPNGSTMNDVPGSARKHRVVYLFVVVLLQAFISWFLI